MTNLGPPATVAHLGNCTVGYLHEINIGDRIGQNKVDLPINQNKTNLKFYKNFKFKFKIEGSLFYEKIANSNI